MNPTPVLQKAKEMYITLTLSSQEFSSALKEVKKSIGKILFETREASPSRIWRF